MNEIENKPQHWKTVQLGELLAYEQPTKYLVESTEYHDSYDIPVLTPGKSFIKGYTNESDGIFEEVPVIIFDDFTTASRYVDFPFKVKSSAMKILKHKPDIADIRFLAYRMQTLSVHSDTHKRYWISIYSQLQISLPPLPEQRAIVAKIEALFSELDEGVARLKEAKEQLKLYRQSVLKAAFEGRLTNDDVPEGELPEGWETQKLESLSDFITKGTTPKKTELNNSNGEIPFIKVYNLTHHGKLDFSVEPTYVTKDCHEGFLKRSIVLPGDVLMNIVGPPLGKVSVVPDDHSEWNINQAIVRFRCTEALDNEYLKWYLLSQNTIKEMMSKSKATAGQFNLTLEICRNQKIQKPPLQEQTQIVQEIENRLSAADEMEEVIDAALAESETLKQSVSKKAFEGKLVESFSEHGSR